VTSILDLPHREACRRVASGAPVFVTVNPVEFHGPHLSLHNDRLVSTGQARELSARLRATHPDWEYLCTDDVEVGFEPCLGPGTRLHPFPRVRDVVLETCRALCELGVQRVVLMTFHGAPMHNMALHAGVRFLEENGVRAVAPFTVVLREMLEFKDPTLYRGAFDAVPAHLRDAMMARLNLDFHAGFFETSMAIHYAPDSVLADRSGIPPCPAWVPDARLLAASRALALTGARKLSSELAFGAESVGWRNLKPFPGYTGAPALANAAAGGFFARHIMDRYVPVVEEVLAGRASSPEPIMAWLHTASLGGRVPT
jgi:creatinine amidohydrolase